MLALDRDCSHLTIQFCTQADLHQLSQTSKKLRPLAEELLWKRRFEKDKPHRLERPYLRSWKAHYLYNQTLRGSFEDGVQLGSQLSQENVQKLAQVVTSTLSGTSVAITLTGASIYYMNHHTSGSDPFGSMAVTQAYMQGTAMATVILLETNVPFFREISNNPRVLLQIALGTTLATSCFVSLALLGSPRMGNYPWFSAQIAAGAVAGGLMSPLMLTLFLGIQNIHSEIGSRFFNQRPARMITGIVYGTTQAIRTLTQNLWRYYARS